MAELGALGGAGAEVAAWQSAQRRFDDLTAQLGRRVRPTAFAAGTPGETTAMGGARRVEKALTSA